MVIDTESLGRRIHRLAQISVFKLMCSGVQLKFRELLIVVRAIQEKPKSNLLVFGVGNDSAFWQAINRHGRTVFLEDDANWLQKVRRQLPQIEAYKIEYGTRMSEWRSYLDRPDWLALALPPQIARIEWDVILVDAPAGYVDFVKLYGVEAPGRMKSIFLASQIVRDGGHVFVHDCEREIERAFADRFLKPENCVAEIHGRALLRHYVMHR